MFRLIRSVALLMIVAAAAPVGAQTATFIEGLSSPYAMLRLDDGRILVSEYLGGRVTVISDTDGEPLDTPQVFITGLAFPTGTPPPG